MSTGEDIQFSHRIFRDKKQLIINEKGFIIHHETEGGRLEMERSYAAMTYNQFIVWKTAVFPYNKLSVIVYLWSLIGEILKFYLAGITKRNKLD